MEMEYPSIVKLYSSYIREGKTTIESVPPLFVAEVKAYLSYLEEQAE